MCESFYTFVLVGFLIGVIFVCSVFVFVSFLNKYVERIKRKKELEEKALKVLSLIVGGKKDEK